MSITIFTLLASTAVTLSIVIVFRYLDRNNRSLEKVKRFTDMIQDRLSGFVEEKTTEVKDLSIELAVNLKTGKEILARTREMEANLIGRTKEVAGLQKQLTGYEKALKDLIDKTARVDENLKRIHTESAFVDGLGRRIKDSTSKMVRLEKAIPHLRQEFSQKNKSLLDGTVSQIKAAVEQRIQTLDASVADSEKRVKDFSVYIGRLESRREAMEKETSNKLDKLANDFILKAKEVRTGMVTELNNRMQKSYEDSEKRRAEFNQAVTGTLAASQTQFNAFAEGLGRRINDFEVDLAAIELNYKKRLESAAQRGEALEHEAFLKLNENMEASVSRFESEMESRFGQLEEELSEGRKELVALFGGTRSDVAVWKAEVTQKMKEGEVEFEKTLSSVRGDLAMKTQTVSNSLAQFIDAQDQKISDSRKRLDNGIQEIHVLLATFKDESQETLEQARGEIEEKQEAVSTDLATYKEESRQKLAVARRDLEELHRALAADMKKDLEGEKDRIHEQLSVMNQDIEHIDTLGAKLENRIEEIASGSEERAEELRTRMSRSEEDLERSLSLISEGMETRVIEGVEGRLAEYEGQLGYRFKKLEQANVDILALEENLRNLMAQIAARLKEDFSSFVDLLEVKRNEEQKRTDGLINGLRGDMSELENGLSDLKTRAYQDVSEKLKVFEHEFLSDLETRSVGMEESLKTWQQGFSSRLHDLAESQEEQREKLELQYREDLKTKLTGLGDSFSRDLTELRDTLDMRQKSLSDELDVGKKTLTDQLNLAEVELSKWKQRLDQEVNRSKAILNNRIVAFTEEIEVNLRGMKDDFTAEKEELIVQSHEERAGLKKELGDISDRVTGLRQHLNEKTASALELFKKRQDELEMQFDLKGKDLQSEIEEHVRKFRSTVGDIAERSRNLQEKLFSRIDEHYKQLDQQLGGIERQQKDFVSQTKLFDRADSLKIDLERHIGELKKNLTLLEPQRKDMQIIEGEFTNTRKLVNEVVAKLAKFQAGRRRVDDLERSFNRLMGLSQSVDDKLAELMARNDLLDDFQLRLRSLEKLEAQVSDSYDRLEKKNDMMETTVLGVEANFQKLGELEGGLKDVDQNLRRLPPQIVELGGQIDRLASSKERADDATEKLVRLDESLEEITERLTKLHTAREWLAKTETRLESLGKQAQEQVQLFKSLVQSKAGKDDGEGAPPLNERETVIKLAKQGWSSKDIARVTNISRGEVELILELAPRKK
jgi:DNA repair exonuclease SbcCD ATPase subunit